MITREVRQAGVGFAGHSQQPQQPHKTESSSVAEGQDNLAMRQPSSWAAPRQPRPIMKYKYIVYCMLEKGHSS